MFGLEKRKSEYGFVCVKGGKEWMRVFTTWERQGQCVTNVGRGSCVLVCLCNETVMENRTGAVKCTYVKERHGD